MDSLARVFSCYDSSRACSSVTFSDRQILGTGSDPHWPVLYCPDRIYRLIWLASSSVSGLGQRIDKIHAEQDETRQWVGMPRRKRPDHYHVYVVLLSERVWNEPAYRKANPEHAVLKPCLYVGMTGLDPDLRFDRHMAGVQANRFVLKYGVRLMPELYEVYNPMPYQAACEMEVELAIGLRESGYGVWQAQARLSHSRPAA